MSGINVTLEEKIQKKKDLDEFKENILDYITEIEQNPDKLDELTDEQIIELHKLKNPYGTTINGDTKYVCLSYTNLREKYIEKLTTTAMIGFLFRACDEYEIDDEELNFEIKEDDFKEEIQNPDSTDEVFVNIKKNELYITTKYEYIHVYHPEQYNQIEEKFDCTKLYDMQYKELTQEQRDTYIQNKNDYIIQYELTLDEELLINTSVKDQLDEVLKPTTIINKEKLLEFKHSKVKEQSEEEQFIIKRYLNRLFKYNADIDVKSSYNSKEASQDKKRKPLKSSDSDNTKSMSELELYESKIPSKDIYYKFNMYKEVNYETLRNSVYNIYGLLPDLEIAFNIYEQFDTIEQANNYVEKYKDKVITDIKTVTTNKWIFSGPFKENRDRISFYNENTIILENIMKQMEDDAKLGGVLIKDKVKKKKIKNVKEVGPDHPNFLQYKKEFASQLDAQGLHTNDDEEDKPIHIVEEIEVDEDGNEVDEDGCPKNALEIDVFHVNAADGTMKTSKLYTKAHKPNNEIVE
jgi:hypothetical protein